MSQLDKTLIIPEDDPNTVVGQPILKMVILGNNQHLAQIANDLALDPPVVDRRVLWFKDPDMAALRHLFKSLADDLGDVLAFSVSTKDLVADYIRKGEQLDYIRVDQSYTRAGLPEYN